MPREDFPNTPPQAHANEPRVDPATAHWETPPNPGHSHPQQYLWWLPPSGYPGSNPQPYPQEGSFFQQNYPRGPTPLLFLCSLLVVILELSLEGPLVYWDPHRANPQDHQGCRLDL
ncbi:hypothetical protein DSO57_1025517 [Entomophthora muscae]|uniref:Uncharacterized protein n=1 Tax=Entomophthora muscae TaxID=34485 RepID=A0ACC2U075_9FUNG|nr:hypothetical protein DSO57_1025517 [Entomophthora muscae]